MDETYDYSSISAETLLEEPERGGGKPKKYERNPFEQWMLEAAAAGNTGKQVILPPKAVRDALYLIRNAATDMGCGVQIRLYNKGTRITQADVGDMAPQAKITVKFWPAPKRTRRARQTADLMTDDEITYDTNL